MISTRISSERETINRINRAFSREFGGSSSYELSLRRDGADETRRLVQRTPWIYAPSLIPRRSLVFLATPWPWRSVGEEKIRKREKRDRSSAGGSMENFQANSSNLSPVRRDRSHVPKINRNVLLERSNPSWRILYPGSHQLPRRHAQRYTVRKSNIRRRAKTP